VDVAALVISVVAVTIAALGFGWTVWWSRYQHRATTTPKLTVSGSFAVLITEPVQDVYGIRAVNDGLVPVTVTGCFAEAEGIDDHLVFARFVMPTKLPVLLTTGEHWEGLIDADQFREGFSKLPGAGSGPWRVRVGVRDAGGRGHWSDWSQLRPGD
jgi:hypothetical protein